MPKSPYMGAQLITIGYNCHNWGVITKLISHMHTYIQTERLEYSTPISQDTWDTTPDQIVYPTPYACRRSLLDSDPMYRRAVTVAGGRYPSDQRLVRRRTPLISLETPPVGNYSPRYFYVEQKRPTPMQPLKVGVGRRL